MKGRHMKNYDEETDRLTMLLVMQMKAYLEERYGSRGLLLCGAITNHLTMRPTTTPTAISFAKENKALIDEAIQYLQQFDGIKDALSILVDTLNQQRTELGEKTIADACLARAKQSGLYVGESYGKSLLKEAQQEGDRKPSPGNQGCLGVILVILGLAFSIALIAMPAARWILR